MVRVVQYVHYITAAPVVYSAILVDHTCGDVGESSETAVLVRKLQKIAYPYEVLLLRT